MSSNLKLLKTCSICELKFELDDSVTSIPCHYGQTANLNGFCLGVDYPPWEISPQGAIALLDKYLRPTNRKLEEIDRVAAWNPRMQEIVRTQSQETLKEISQTQRRIKKWKRINFKIVEKTQ